MDRFWMIWSPAGRAPMVQHDSPNKARAEAERLARANPGQQFYVLEAQGVCQLQDVIWTSFELPF
jgi:hypothetical protein